MNFLLCDIPYLVQAPPLCSSAYVATSKEAGKLINVRRGFKLTDRNFADEVSYFPNAFPHAPGPVCGPASFRPYYENPYSEHYVGLSSSVRRHSLRPTPDAPSDAPSPSASRLQRLLGFLRRLPVVIFYRYLWRNNRKLFLRGLLINYILPMVLELLPIWWLSSRKMHIELRSLKIKITHNMQTGKSLDSSQLSTFFWITIWHCVMDVLMQHMALKVSRENGLVIKKLVMERLLYAELGYIEEIRTLDLETQISNDVNQTLSFFNYTLPALLGSVYSLAREGTDLFNRRDTVDYLFYVHPIALGLVKKAINWVKFWLYDKPLADRWSTDNARMGQFVTNALAGLAEIQINNLQLSQLSRLDALTRAELKAEDTYGTLAARWWNHLSGRSLLEFVSEVWTVHQVMTRRGINHEQFRRLQFDVDRVLELAQRTYTLLRVSRNVIDYQMQVVDLFAIPNWLDEDERIPDVSLTPFKRIEVRGPLMFSYPGARDIALRLTGEQCIVFEAGKHYAVIGENRSGKSTLANLLCKLYQPHTGSLSINEVPYSRLRRTSIRSLITYVSQKPYLFPGSIRENIRIGNESATDDQIRRAAEFAGVFAFGMTEKPRHIHTPRKTVVMSSAPATVDVEDEKEAALAPVETGDEPLVAVVSKEAKRTEDKQTRNGEGGEKSGGESDFETDEEGPNGEETQQPHAFDLLDMQVAARGANVSGGFGQSIALARIFVRPEARVIILDEAMSQMDPYKKREIIGPRLRAHIKRLGITLITISHDIPSVQDADCIYVLHRGTLAHVGSHQELVESKAAVYLNLLGKRDED